MRETRWPAARGRAGLLIDRPRLQARALDGLGQTLISGDLEAAVAALAPGAPIARPLRARARGRACAAHRPRERASRHARAARPRRRLARRLVRDERRRRLGGGRSLWRGRAAGAHAGDLGRPRRRLALGCRARLRPARPPGADGSGLPACMSRRRGWRRCSPGSTASSRKPNRVAALLTASSSGHSRTAATAQWRGRRARLRDTGGKNGGKAQACSDPGRRRRWFQSADRLGRGPHFGSAPGSAQRSYRPHHRRAQRARVQAHRRRGAGRVSQRGRCGALRHRSAKRHGRTQRRRSARPPHRIPNRHSCRRGR